MSISVAVNANDFRAKLQAIADKLETSVETAVKEVAKSIFHNLIENTPIFSGTARANWQMALNSPNDNYIYDPKSVHIRGSVDYGSYNSQSEQQVEFYKSGDIIYITNAAPYIEALDAGRSPQAPAGYVESAIEAGVSTIGDHIEV